MILACITTTVAVATNATNIATSTAGAGTRRLRMMTAFHRHFIIGGAVHVTS